MLQEGICFIVLTASFFYLSSMMKDGRELNPFRAPESLPILKPSNFVPKNGFPVAKGLTLDTQHPKPFELDLIVHRP